MPEEHNRKGDVMLDIERLSGIVQLGKDIFTISYTCALETLIGGEDVIIRLQQGHGCYNCPYRELNNPYSYGCITFFPEKGSRVI